MTVAHEASSAREPISRAEKRQQYITIRYMRVIDLTHFFYKGLHFYLMIFNTACFILPVYTFNA